MNLVSHSSIVAQLMKGLRRKDDAIKNKSWYYYKMGEMKSEIHEGSINKKS